MNNITYFSCHCHSEFSNLRLIDSINRIEDEMEYAYKLGLAGWVLTDHDSISGHYRAQKYYYAKINHKMKNDPNPWDRPFRFALGNEIYLTREGLTEQDFVKDVDFFYHLILIAKDEIGHRQIRELSAMAWKRGYFRGILHVFNYPSDLSKVINGGHVICSTACLGGYTARQVLAENYERADNFVKVMQGLFGKDNFYIELQPSFSEDQIKFNKYAIEHWWGKYPFIFTTDSHYLKKEDREVHKAFLNSKSSDSREVDSFYSATYFMSYDEVCDYFKDYIPADKIQEMATNTIKIMNSCTDYTLVKPQVVTQIKYEAIEDDRADFCRVLSNLGCANYPYVDYYFNHPENEADDYFAKLLAIGWKREQIPESKHLKYISRLNDELRAVREISLKLKLNMSDYFTSMWKMISIIWNDADSLVGPSRGSAGGFLVNYLLGITQMNPIEQDEDLPYWRFLHEGRPNLPDIDIDTEASKRVKVFNKVQAYFQSIGGDLINVCTFGTEGSKSALRTAARGLGIADEVITYLVSMIPNERGFDWTLDQCYNGDGSDHPQIKKFREEVDKYDHLWEVAHGIEGLVTHLGVHASGVIAVNGNFLDYNGIMKTSKDQIVSAFDLHDSEDMGLIKYDYLTVNALDRIRQTMNYLLEDGMIDWQGSLKATYDKYLAPKVLDYTSPEMWDLVGEGKISSLFQFDTMVGAQAIKKIKPRNIKELSIANSLVRLMNPDGIQPLDIYVDHKNNINNWYNEMAMAGLTGEEVHILEKYLLKRCGVAESQESLMRMVMDPHITNFTMEQANFLRKTIAKKDFRDINAVKELYYKQGESVQTRTQMLDYIWQNEISLQLGYSFSEIHTTGYSLLALQEMNLAYHYPIIYWNCACLSADSSAINEQDFYNLLDQGVIEISDEEDIRDSNKTDTAKIATAIDHFKHVMKISTPDINKSRLGFTPDVNGNRILYGLKGITNVTTPVIEQIMQNRPFSGVLDFVSRVTKKVVSCNKVINLIKAGAFNNVEGKTTEEVLREYIATLAEPKSKLTMQNAQMLIEHNLIPQDTYGEAISFFKLTKQLRQFKDDNGLYYILAAEIDRTLIYTSGIEIKNMDVYNNGRVLEVIDCEKWDALYASKMLPIKKYITQNQADLLKKINDALFNDVWVKYCSGDQLQWELDSLSFYYSGNPLDKVFDQMPIPVSTLADIEEGKIDGFFTIKGKQIPKMHLYSIIGTVLDRNTTKGIVTIQTTDGVVGCKLYKDLFAFYNHEFDIKDGDKTYTENSFFDIGTHLLITGIKRGETFVPKVYKNTGLKAIERIKLDKDNNFEGLEEKQTDIAAGDPNSLC
jgi:DNA polymerase-3 subunit alpha